MLRKIIAVTITATALGLVGSTTSTASTLTVKLSKTEFTSAQDELQISLASFPIKAGIYLQQCVEPAAGARPTQCNKATQLWVTKTPGGSYTPDAAITMKIVSAFDGVDCTTVSCGIFARLDHTAGPDTSEDQFQKISFKVEAVVTTTTVTTTPVLEIAKIPSILKSVSITKKKYALPTQTDKGTLIRYRTSTAKICSVNNNILTLKSAGACKIQAYAAATDKVGMSARNLILKITK